MIFKMAKAKELTGGRYLSLSWIGGEEISVCAGSEMSLTAADPYQEDMDTGEILKNELSFRDLAQFKICRARGDFLAIGIK